MSRDNYAISSQSFYARWLERQPGCGFAILNCISGLQALSKPSTGLSPSPIIFLSSLSSLYSRQRILSICCQQRGWRRSFRSRSAPEEVTEGEVDLGFQDAIIAPTLIHHHLLNKIQGNISYMLSCYMFKLNEYSVKVLYYSSLSIYASWGFPWALMPIYSLLES